jgi:hypothetical protein
MLIIIFVNFAGTFENLSKKPLYVTPFTVDEVFFLRVLLARGGVANIMKGILAFCAAFINKFLAALCDAFAALF